MLKLLKLCECGCGQETKLASKTSSKRGWVKGQPLRFINGHNTKFIERSNSKIKKNCIICGKEFEVFPTNKNAVHCSNTCGRITVGIKRSTKENHIRKTSTGYLQIKLSNHPYCDNQGFVMYHRHIMEQHLGYYLSRKFDVHHIDENKENNEISNLVTMNRSAHMYYHFMKRRKEGKI